MMRNSYRPREKSPLIGDFLETAVFGWTGAETAPLHLGYIMVTVFAAGDGARLWLSGSGDRSPTYLDGTSLCGRGWGQALAERER